MSAATIILIILIIITFIASLIVFIILFQKYRQPIITGKHITNHLHRFTEGYKFGSLVKMVPTGKNGDLKRIHFTVKEKDEYGEKKIVEKVIIAKNRFIQEDQHGITIIPQYISELDNDKAEMGNLVKAITESNGIDIIAESSKLDKQKFIEIFKNNYGGELSSYKLKNILDIIKIYEENAKKEENKDKK